MGGSILATNTQTDLGTTALSRSDRTGSWAGLQWQARSFTRAGTGVVTAAAVAAVLLGHAQLSQVAKNHVFANY